MCATCVAQGVVYVGAAVAGLRVMGARAKAGRRVDRAADGDRPVEADIAERQTAAGP